MRFLMVTCVVVYGLVGPSECDAQSVARQWNEALMDAIRIDFPAPTVHSRNLYHVSAAMYDAWATFDPLCEGSLNIEKNYAENIAEARNEAISFAAYRVLSSRYELSDDPATSQARFDGLMNSLGYDASFASIEGNSPAAIGNRIADQILTSTLDDGANEANGYVDNTNYAATNDPMVVDFPSVVTPDAPPLSDPNRWQPLFLDSAVTQNGLEGDSLQTYVGPHWGDVTTFAMGQNAAPGSVSWAELDPGAPPLLNGTGDETYRQDSQLVIRYSHSLDPTQGPGAELINISPNATGNRPLGTHEDRGYDQNPITGQPYADNFVKAADYGRILAEFWADGPSSETPPGHWNVLANEVSEHPLTQKRVGGVGDVVDDLEWDVKLYLALNGAAHDSAVAAWGIKREYDYVRPITKIRYQGSLGQSSNSELVSYHPDGLRLESDLVELITAESIADGGRHRNAYVNANLDAEGNFVLHYSEAQMVGKVAINAWNHEPEDPATQVSGIDWILAENWVPYQDDNFVTPAFAAYVSGHSTFSRAAAEVMSAITGSEFFPGGLGEQVFEVDWLEFEKGPTEELTLQWARYVDAADEAGISRLWGGIHVPVDDFAGRIIGAQIGQDAAARAQDLFVSKELTWHNRVLAEDVNFDNEIAPLDAIRVINELNLRVYSEADTGALGSTDGLLDIGFLDVNNDGIIAPTDAIRIINLLNSRSAALSQAVPEPNWNWAMAFLFLPLLLSLRPHRSPRQNSPTSF